MAEGFFSSKEAAYLKRARRAWMESEARAIQDLRERARVDFIKAERETPIRRLTWRDVSRICLPGWFIGREIEALTGPLYRAGPDLAQRLERHIERFDDIQAPGRLAGLTRSAALWLTQSPNDGRQAIPEQTCHEPTSEPTPDLSPWFAPESRWSGEKE